MNKPAEPPTEDPAVADGLRRPDGAEPQMDQVIALAGEALRATRVEMRLQKHNGVHSMVITDNGQGFAGDDAAIAKSSNRLGKPGMRERMEIIGGTFGVASVPGQHTTVLVEIPLI